MNKKNWTRHLAWGVLGLVSQQVFPQVTVPNNNGQAGAFVGWNAGANQVLEVKNEANQPIDWYTNAIQRMRLMPTGQTVINGYTLSPTDQDGFLLLSATDNAFTNLLSNAPFSRLHLVDDEGNNVPLVYAQEMGYRPWMRNGITFTGNSDQGYIGQQYMAPDATDMVIQWSDNPESDPWAADRMRFVFASDPNPPSPTGMSSLNGLEAMRLYPVDPFNVNVGIGDWLVPGSGDPLDRLDILTGRLRIRDLPTDPQGIGLTKVLVVDDQNPAELGVVKWLDISNLGGADCDWEVTGGSDVVTAHLAVPPTGCPGEADNVGIGTATPVAKVDVVKSVNTGGGIEVGVNVRMATTGATNIGGVGTTNTTSALFNIGWQGNATNGSRRWGLDGNAALTNTSGSSSWNGARVVGVRGFADGEFGLPAEQIRGVWGVGVNPFPGGWGYGGWFDGYVYSSLGQWGPSDLNLKDNIQVLSDATSVLSQLQPRSYVYRSADYPTLALDDEVHYGLIAQEVEAILPTLVRETGQPEVLDSLGNVVYPAVQFKSMNYEGLIPWLIAGFNEQQARIDQLEADLASCCTLDDTGLDMRSGEYDGFTNATSLENDRLTIAPNPFQERTTLSYLLQAPARVRLQVHTESGMHLATLRDQPQEPGSYSMTWDTQDLAPGLYYVTLFADGKPVVKKAIKVR